MTMSTAIGATHAAAIAEAIKVSGTIVHVPPEGFLEVLRKNESPLVVSASGGIFGKKYDYLTSYKGLCFYTRADEALQLPGRAEIVSAKKIWIPGNL
jgi:hypothetical protein